MWTREMLIVAGCLVSSSVLAAGGYSDGEAIPAPAGYSQASGSVPCNTACDTTAGPPVQPWYYWWTSWHWFDRCTDRGQHEAYLPPLPGWYYFRPYSVGQLRAQQEAVMGWGGDPRNPYATGTLPQQPAPATPAAPATSARTAPAAPATAAPSAAITRLSSLAEGPSPSLDSLPALTAPSSKAAETPSRTTAAPSRPTENVSRPTDQSSQSMNNSSRPTDRPSRTVEAPSMTSATSAAPSRSMDVQLAALISSPETGEKREVKSIPVVDPVSEPASSVIPWPPALRHARFAAERKKIEAPYVRNLAGGAAPTAADFRNMIDAAEQMKAELWKMTVDISVEDTATADKFLDQLVSEARGQLGAASGTTTGANSGAPGGQNRLVFGQ